MEALSVELREELSDVISDIVAQQPTEAFVDFIINNYPDLISEGIRWRFIDTVVRGKLMNACSHLLIGKSWPEYRDRLTDEQLTEFTNSIKSAYAAWELK